MIDYFAAFYHDLVGTVQCTLSPINRLEQNKQLSDTDLFASSDELKDHQTVENTGRSISLMKKSCKLTYGTNKSTQSVYILQES